MAALEGRLIPDWSLLLRLHPPKIPDHCWQPDCKVSHWRWWLIYCWLLWLTFLLPWEEGVSPIFKMDSGILKKLETALGCLEKQSENISKKEKKEIIWKHSKGNKLKLSYGIACGIARRSQRDCLAVEAVFFGTTKSWPVLLFLGWGHCELPVICLASTGNRSFPCQPYHRTGLQMGCTQNHLKFVSTCTIAFNTATCGLPWVPFKSLWVTVVPILPWVLGVCFPTCQHELV